MNTKVQLLGLDAEVTVRYVKLMRSMGVTNISIIQDLEMGMHAIDHDCGIALVAYDQIDPLSALMLEYLQLERPQVTPIMITRSADLRTVVDALRYGALDQVVQGEGDVVHLEAVIHHVVRMRDLLNADRSELWNQISNRINAA
jgi:DNA-binding NtrC family response regulator